MHPKTFEETQVSKDDIEDWQFLVDGEDMEVKLIFFNGKVIGNFMAELYCFQCLIFMYTLFDQERNYLSSTTTR